MIRLVLLVALLGAWLAVAADKKAITPEEAEKRAEAAQVKACQLAKDRMAKHEACADEYGQMAAIICSDKESRGGVEYAKLDASCAKKLKTVKKAPAKKR